MVITRKIEIKISESDETKRKEYYKTLYDWRDKVRDTANIIVSHQFVQSNIHRFMYLNEDAMKAFLMRHPDRVKESKKTGNLIPDFKPKDILREEPGFSKQNTTYRIAAEMLKGQMSADIYSSLNQLVVKSCGKTMNDVINGKTTLRSYRNDIPIPFSSKAILNTLHEVEEEYENKDGNKKTTRRFYFTLFGIPFICWTGKDRSNNKVILRRILSTETEDSGYKLCSSSIAFEKVVDRLTGDKKQKMFLYLCVDIPEKNLSPVEGKTLYAYLSPVVPILYNLDKKVSYDNLPKGEDTQREESTGSDVDWFNIGTEAEFLHRRIAIQRALKRCQINNRYSKGGHGRKRKLQAIDHYHEMEKNYITSRMHVYSRRLIDAAVKYRCAVICLVDQKRREKKAKEEYNKGDHYVIRNWSYYGLKQMIEYKAKMYGITVVDPGDKKEKTED